MRASPLFRISLGLLFVLAGSLESSVAAEASLAAEGSLGWERVAVDPGAPATALALDGTGARIAIGTTRGVSIGKVDGAPRRVLARGPVLDLTFSGDGTLWVATGEGLYRVDRDAGFRREALGPGHTVREVRRVTSRAGRVAVATAGGVHLRDAAGAWRRLSLPLGGASLVALLPVADGVRVVAEVAGALWSGRLSHGRGASRELARLPAPLLSELPVDATVDNGSLLLIHARALALERPDAGGWRVIRPVLSPGARVVRHARALGRHWLATDAGLLSSETLNGRWTATSGPVARLPALALAGDASSLHVVTASGVFRARAAATGVPRRIGGDPPIAAVQRAALRHQGLEPARMRAMRRDVALRGWLPDVRVHGSYERSRSRGRDFDEAFLSGATRYLQDRDDARDREAQLSLTLSWELGDLVFHPEQVDVSREARAVIALRDDVLDEVGQLYYERQRALAEHAALPRDDPGRLGLALRAAELAAGLDAWTGGWFGAQRDVGTRTRADQRAPFVGSTRRTLPSP